MVKPIKAFIVDLDGTLANGNGRDFFNPTRSEIYSDSVIKPVQKVLQALNTMGYYFIFVSGRFDKYKDISSEWVKDKVFTHDFQSEFHFRKDGDTRHDDLVKKEIYDTHIKNKFEIIGVFDDRLKVCKMWYNEGLFVFNVNQGLKEF